MFLRVLRWSVVSALAGFLFGFDTVVISGAEQAIQKLWNLSPEMHGIVTATALYGMVLGSLLGGWPTDRFGRKATLLGIGVLFVVSAVGCAFAWDPWSFVVARFLGGVGIGVSTVAAPLYIAEIAPPAYRGRLAGMFQFNIVFGILVAFASNYLLQDVGVQPWRWMLGVAVFPSIVYAALCLTLPESPRWLLSRRRDRPAGLRVLRLINPEASAEALEAEADAMAASPQSDETSASLWGSAARRPLLLAFFIAFFNQLSGINAILYFAPRIFKLAGFGANAALLESIGLGVANLIFTFVGLWLIDRLGRRALLAIGTAGYLLSLGLTAWAFFTERYAIVPACIFAFIAAHAIGQGTVIWVFISEIFPTRLRASGQAFGSATHWVFAALLTTLFPNLVERFPPGYVFLFFFGMMALQGVWVAFFMPETKGVPLEEMQRRLAADDAR